MKNILYTCLGGAGGWAVIRSLENDPDYRLVGVDADPFASALYQPGLAACSVVPWGTAPDYIEVLLEICGRENIDAIWPGSDEEVERLARDRAILEERGIKVIVAPLETVLRSINKPAMVDLAAKANVPVPRTARLDQDISWCDRPVIVRPVTARGGKGVTFFERLDDVSRFRDGLADKAGSWFVQERIQSKAGDMHLYAAIFDWDQNRLAQFMSRSIKTMYPWGGPSLGGVPVRSPRLAELGAAIFAASGPWFGPVNAEFLYDAARDDFVFIEVNPRYWGYSYLATAAGINFPRLVLDMAFGKPVIPQEDYSVDVVTLTSREQIAVPLSTVLGAIPPGSRRPG